MEGASVEEDRCCCWQALCWAAGRWHETLARKADRPELDVAAWRFASVGEALFWAAALDDLRGRAGAGDDTRRLLEGLRFVRNRMTHSLVRATDQRDGAVFPISFPMVFAHWVWRDAIEIPPPAQGPGKNDAGERAAAYRARWEGREVGATLDQLRDWFAPATTTEPA